MCGGVLCLLVCKCTTCMPTGHRGQKKVSDPLELDLRIAVSHDVGLGIKPMFSGRVESANR